ncbi:MAG: response regulator [Calothrix sp. FI2-JRJ7]|nr:response regulator [Calothrix sp. FI2-JRJ7]
MTQANNLCSDLNGVNILVVDDELHSRELLSFILTEQYAKVTAVASGIEALSVLSQSISDLLISDIGMPNMDGYNLIQKIRASEKTKSIPAIAVSAYTGQLNEQQAIKAGLTDTLLNQLIQMKL